MWRRCWDHPRACGAHAGLPRGQSCAEGSSPRMRGSPSSNTTSALSLWDHPRACGAHPIDLNDAEFTVGSSPRMRGSLKEVDRDHNLIGIIPAHAGLTESVKLVHARRWDHPRACGAHKLDEVLCKRLKGSSPRMRGSPQMCRVWRGWHGIIPAHAGLTGELRPVQIYGCCRQEQQVSQR